MTEPPPSPPPSSSILYPGKEFEFLCALAGTRLSREQIERIASWNLSVVDWNAFLRLAEHHGVVPLAARNLMNYASGLPSAIELSLHSSYETNLRRSLWFAGNWPAS